MHRQSLGSPNSKLDSNGVFIGGNENIQLQQQVATQLGGDEEQLRKAQKAHKSGEKVIHIIPMLVILCFLILYLTSHDPSQKQGVTAELKNSNTIEISSEIDNLGGATASDVFVIGSSRNLQEEELDNNKRTRINRKLHHFWFFISLPFSQ